MVLPFAHNHLMKIELEKKYSKFRKFTIYNTKLQLFLTLNVIVLYSHVLGKITAVHVLIETRIYILFLYIICCYIFFV